MIAQDNFENVEETKVMKLERLKKKKLQSRLASVTFGAMLLLPNAVTSVEAAETGVVEAVETTEPAETPDIPENTEATDTFEVAEITISAPEVYDVATHKSRTVEGMLPENATEIRVYLPGDSEEFRLARILSARPGGGQSFSLRLPDGYSFSAGQEVRVIATDDAGNTSEATLKTVLDSESIANLTVDPIYENAETISGTVNPAASVQVVLPGSGPMISASVKADGSWTLQTRANARHLVADENVNIRVRVDGNTHNFNQIIEEEPVVVNQPTINNPVSPYANIISIKAEPQTNIALTLPNGDVLSGRTNNWGNLNLNVPENAGLAVGEIITVIASNDQGVSSSPLEYALPDLLESTQLVVNPILPEEAHTGIFGKAVPGAFVTVHLPRNTSRSVQADENGDWFIDTVGHRSRLTPGVTVDVSVAIGGVPHRNVVRAEVVEVPGEIDSEASTLVLNRLGYYNARYYQARVTLVDEYGLPVEGLTQEDFELIGFGGLEDFSAEGNVYKLNTAEAGKLRPDHSFTIQDGKIVVTIEDERESDIDLENSQVILTRLGSYGNRYYQAQIRLLDELGRPVEGLTESDFEILGFGGITNFQADGNYYRLDTAEADKLRPNYTISLKDGKIVVTIEDERESDIDLENSQVILTRLGSYGNRYYQAQIRLLDELGRPVEGLTESDFEILGFGGITNFQADGNYYRLDTAEADKLRPTYTISLKDGKIVVTIEDEREDEVAFVEINPVFAGDSLISGVGTPGEWIEIVVSGSVDLTAVVEIGEDGRFAVDPGAEITEVALLRMAQNAGYVAQSGDVITVRWASGDGRVLDEITVQEAPVEVDLSELEELLATASGISNDDGRFTAESFAALSAAIAEAQVALGEIETEEDLAIVMDTLQAAIDGLVEADAGGDENGENPSDGDEIDPDADEDPEEGETPDQGESGGDADTDDQTPDAGDDQETPAEENEDQSGEEEADTESDKNDDSDDKELPKTGTASAAGSLIAGMLSLLSGIGLAFKRRKNN